MTQDDLLKRITANPEIFGGKPIIRGRRMAVEHVLGKRQNCYVVIEVKMESSERMRSIACSLPWMRTSGNWWLCSGRRTLELFECKRYRPARKPV